MTTATLRTPRPRKSVAPVTASPVRIRSILVPTDFSSASTKALAYAAALAEQFDAKITLLYVNEPIVMPDFANSFPLVMENDNLMASFKENLERLVKKNWPILDWSRKSSFARGARSTKSPKPRARSRWT